MGTKGFLCHFIEYHHNSFALNSCRIDFWLKWNKARPVRKGKRFTLYTLLFVFGFLSIKSLFPVFSENVHGDCQEFAHIHFFKVKATSFGNDTISKNNKSDEDDNNYSCHSSQIVYYFFPFPHEIYETKSSHKTIFEIVLNLENNFKSPNLEPQKKPPRQSA